MVYDRGFHNDLQHMDRVHLTAFAASCAERLLPDYEAFVIIAGWGNYAALRAALDNVWLWLKGGSVNGDYVHSAIDECYKYVPDVDNGPEPYKTFAENASAAVIYSMRCIEDGDWRHAASAGRAALDTVYQYLAVVNTAITTSHAVDPGERAHNDSAPLMIAEINTQRMDMDELRRHAELTPQFVFALRERSSRLGLQLIARGLVPRIRSADSGFRREEQK